MPPHFQDIPDKYLVELRNLLKQRNSPYVEINIINRDQDSLIVNTATKVEAVINSILGDIFLAYMEEGVYLLGSLEDHMDNLLALSAVLRVKHEKTKLNTTINKILVEDKKRNRTPIPKVFEDAFDKDEEGNNA